MTSNDHKRSRAKIKPRLPDTRFRGIDMQLTDKVQGIMVRKKLGSAHLEMNFTTLGTGVSFQFTIAKSAGLWY